MFNMDKSLKKLIGTPRRGGKNDWDGDGVPNRKDCQPRNTMRQDKLNVGILNIDRYGGTTYKTGITELKPAVYASQKIGWTPAKWKNIGNVKIADMEDAIVGFGKNPQEIKKAVQFWYGKTMSEA